MAYTPATLTLATWSTPITIQSTDALTGLDDAVNSIVDTSAGSIKNHINTELAKVPTYLSAELVKVNSETATQAGIATAQAGIATTKADEASASALSASDSLASVEAVASSILSGTIDDINTSTLKTWSSSKVNTELGTKQATLVSGTNIKTINGVSPLGSGDIVIDQINDSIESNTDTWSSSKIKSSISTSGGLEKIFDTVLNIDLTEYFPTGRTFTVSNVFPYYESGNDYKYLAVVSVASVCYILPIQRISGTVTVGTAVLYNNSTTPSTMHLMSNNRVVLARSGYVGVLDCSTFLAPTYGTEVAMTTGSINGSAIDGTRVVFIIGNTTPFTVACAIDIGASGTTVTLGADVSIFAAYNSANFVKFFDNTHADKVDAILASSASQYAVVQIKATGTVVTISGTPVLTGTIYDLANNFTSTVETQGTLLIPTFTTSTAYVNKIILDQSSTLTSPTVAVATNANGVYSTNIAIKVIKTKVANIYLLLGSSNSASLQDTATVYSIYNSSTNTITTGASLTGLIVSHVAKGYSDMSGKTTNDIMFTGSLENYSMRLTVSPTTGEITAVRVYLSTSNPTSYKCNAITVGENHYLQQMLATGDYRMTNFTTGTSKRGNHYIISSSNGVYFTRNSSTIAMSALVGNEFEQVVGAYFQYRELPYFPYGKLKTENSSMLEIFQPKAVL